MPSAPAGLVMRFCRSHASPSALASSGRICATVSASRSWVLSGQGASAVRLLVHDPGQRAALGPAGLHQLELVRELVDVPDAQVGDDVQVLGQAEGADHLALVEEADPADAEALGARAASQEVLDRERGGYGAICGWVCRPACAGRRASRRR